MAEGILPIDGSVPEPKGVGRRADLDPIRAELKRLAGFAPGNSLLIPAEWFRPDDDQAAVVGRLAFKIGKGVFKVRAVSRGVRVWRASPTETP